MGFAARWTGIFTAPTTGNYHFSLWCDDGCKLFINGGVVIDSDGLKTGSSAALGTVFLVEGGHPIRVEYYVQPHDGQSVATLMLFLTDGTFLQDISSHLSHGTSQTTLTSVSSTGSGVIGVSLASTTVPANAFYLLAFSSSANGENPVPASVLISDGIRPTQAPSNSHFVDEDPGQGFYAGGVSFVPPTDTALITHFEVYWGSSATVPDFSFGPLGNASVWNAPFITISSTQAPSQAITHLVVVSANGAVPMLTGSGVLLQDWVSITAVPSSIAFNDTDQALGSIGGTVTLGAAADESQVGSYAVYWGASSTVKLPGGSPGLNAEFFALTSCPSASVFPDISALGSPFLSQVETVNSYSSSRPGGSLSMWPGVNRSEYFAARWRGWIQVLTAGSYWFRLFVDDRARLLINGVEVSLLNSGWSDEYTGTAYLTTGIHTVELQYYQCVGHSFVSLTAAGPDTFYTEASGWSLARTGAEEASPLATVAKEGALVATIPSGTAIPAFATHLLAFARTASGVDAVGSASLPLVDFVKPVVTAQSVQFIDVDLLPNMISGVITIQRATNEVNLDSYKIYWGTSATDILVPSSRRLQVSTFSIPTCTGSTCSDIQITAGSNSNEWIVSRSAYNNYESAFLTLAGPAQIQFTFLSTETCCDKIRFPDQSPISGYNIPSPFTLPPGAYSVEWSSDYSVTRSGWTFTYTFTGTDLSNPAMVASIPKPAGTQDLVVVLGSQQPLGSHFIVKAAYDQEEADTSVSLQIQDVAPPQLPIGALTFTDTNAGVGVISGNLVIASAGTDPALGPANTGFNVYWAMNSSHEILTGALIGQTAAAASGDTTFQIQNLNVPSEASHLLVRGYTAQGEGLNSSSIPIPDAFSPSELASGVHFVDTDPAAGTIAGAIIVEPATNQSSISEYVIYWGSSSTTKLNQVPLSQVSAAAGNVFNCGVKGADGTPWRLLRNGVNGPKIVNGQEASPCEWRWQVSLRYTGGFHFCGGALISPRWVMTAAHCIPNGQTFVVVVGDHDKDSPLDTHEREYAIQRIVSHPSYSPSTLSHDFALLELAQDVEMGDCVATACLSDEDVAVSQECYITGWGTLSSGGNTPSRLQEGMVVTLSNSICGERYAGYGEITPEMVCAQGTSSAGIVDSCQGDSGGPLVCAGHQGRYFLHAATSWGIGCADSNYPGVYARISAVRSWVQAETGLEPGSGASGNLTLNLSSQAIPASATHLLVYSSMNGLEMSTGISIPLDDYVPLQATPSSIAFTDTDASPGELGGIVTLGRAADESQVTGYAVYWGDSSATFDLVAQVPTGAGNVEIVMPVNTPKPAAATHLRGFLISAEGRSLNSVSLSIVDLDNAMVPGGLTFQDTNENATQIGGVVTIQQAASTTGITSYNLYLSSGNCVIVGTALASVPVPPGAGSPTCISGASCSLISVIDEGSGRYVISRGMSGYGNDEYALLRVHGPGMVSFSRFHTEQSYDTLRVDQTVYSGYSGSSTPADLELGEGVKEIEWFSDFSVTKDGWVLTFQSYSNFGDIAYSLQSTPLPPSANSMMVYSVSNGVENTAACALTGIVDFAPPSQGAQGLWFTDVNPVLGRVAGTITILQARDDASVTEYQVYWGQNSSHIAPGTNLLMSVPASGTNTNLTVSLGNTTLPANTTHLLAFAASANGISQLATSTEVMDYHPAQALALGVSFTDVDPGVGYVTGTAEVQRAVDESTIEEYRLYFSTGQTKLSFIGSAPATTVTRRPSCSGQSCSQISIVEIASSYEVSRFAAGSDYGPLGCMFLLMEEFMTSRSHCARFCHLLAKLLSLSGTMNMQVCRSPGQRACASPTSTLRAAMTS